MPTLHDFSARTIAGENKSLRDYDGHYCALREPAALEIFRDFAAMLQER